MKHTEIPKHIAIIMDGNGRWAKSHGYPKILGHKKGAEVVDMVVKACVRMNIPYLTLYAFSSENWNRPEEEVNSLMDLLLLYLKKEVVNLQKNNIKLKVIGDISRLPKMIIDEIVKCEELTKNNQAINLNIALSYGSRQEMLAAVKDIAQAVQARELKISDINEEYLSNSLYTSQIPDPDLLIRTSGEQRLSNFLLWQSAYTELYFSKVLWPDFTEQDLEQAIIEYQNRERRYGS